MDLATARSDLPAVDDAAVLARRRTCRRHHLLGLALRRFGTADGRFEPPELVRQPQPGAIVLRARVEAISHQLSALACGAVPLEGSTTEGMGCVVTGLVSTADG